MVSISVVMMAELWDDKRVVKTAGNLVELTVWSLADWRVASLAE